MSALDEPVPYVPTNRTPELATALLNVVLTCHDSERQYETWENHVAAIRSAAVAGLEKLGGVDTLLGGEWWA